MAITFDTPKDFPQPDDVKKEGDTHRFLADLECTSIDEDGEMHWKLIALDGVKLPEDEEEGEESDSDDGMSEYDESEDESDDSAPKDAKGVAALILKPPAQ